jgi:hypothetical protein
VERTSAVIKKGADRIMGHSSKIRSAPKLFISNWRECDKPVSVGQCKSRLIQTPCAPPDQIVCPIGLTRRPAVGELSVGTIVADPDIEVLPALKRPRRSI